MKSKKPLIFFITVLALIASIEVFVRMNVQSVIAIQDKMLLKKQMVLLRKPTDVLFLGSSRTQDSVEPRVLIKSMTSIDPSMKRVSIFNAAVSGANLSRLEYFVENILGKKSFKLLVIELSDPQIFDGPLGFEFNEEFIPKTAEERLQKLLSDNVYIVKYRKLFRLDTIRKAFILTLSNVSVGTELFRRALLVDLFEKIDDEKLTQASLSGHWQPQIIEPKKISSDYQLNDKQTKAIGVLKKLVQIARNHDVEVLFLIPPLRGYPSAEEFDPLHQEFYQHLSNETDSNVISTSSLELSPLFFRNDSHLNKMGRTLWSDQLGSVIVRTLKRIEKKPDAI